MFASLLQSNVTYCPPETPDGTDVPAGAPVAIVCRWQGKVERRFDAVGREYVSIAIIYTTAELQKDGWLFRGTTTLADPVDAGAFRIRDVYRTQDPGGGLVVWKIYAG